MKYTVTVRAKLRATPAEAKKYHDEVTRATKDGAKKAGDLTHVIYLDPQDPKAFLGIDTWSSLEGLQAFAASPQIKDFFGKLFDGEPEVRVWVDSDWNQW
jgi:quinol monooxygenase YgiN